MTTALATAAAQRGYVYFIRDDDRIKIGRSLRPQDRVKQVQATVGVDPRAVLLATTPGGPKLEAELHRRFAHLRVRGEWFDAAPELLDFVGKISCLRWTGRQFVCGGPR